jgi:hypothetical protein
MAPQKLAGIERADSGLPKKNGEKQYLLHKDALV